MQCAFRFSYGAQVGILNKVFIGSAAFELDKREQPQIEAN